MSNIHCKYPWSPVSSHIYPNGLLFSFMVSCLSISTPPPMVPCIFPYLPHPLWSPVSFHIYPSIYGLLSFHIYPTLYGPQYISLSTPASMVPCIFPYLCHLLWSPVFPYLPHPLWSPVYFHIYPTLYGPLYISISTPPSMVPCIFPYLPHPLWSPVLSISTPPSMVPCIFPYLPHPVWSPVSFHIYPSVYGFLSLIRSSPPCMASSVLHIYPTLQGSGDTDTEKQLHKLEQENDCLQHDLMDSQQKLSAVQCLNSSSENDSERLMRVSRAGFIPIPVPPTLVIPIPAECFDADSSQTMVISIPID